MRTSTRGEVDPFIVMDVMEAARREEAAGRGVIHMEVGQPGRGAPEAAQAALAAALGQSALGYTVALGIPALREGIARLYGDWYGLDLDPARVVVTSGSSAAFLLAFTSLFEPGERVAIGERGYPSYPNILKCLDLEPVGIQTRAEDRFQPRPEDLGADLAGLLVASPANPTGTVLEKPEMAALIGAAAELGIAFISDEIYHGIDFGRRAVSALEVSDDVYVINSFSKYFCMTGWRVGWMVVPPDHVRRIERLTQNMFICPPHASQVVALGALEAREELEAQVRAYGANRALLLEGLPKAGFGRITAPDGAFYIYADVSDLTSDSRDLAARILREAGVALTPGLDFDPKRGHRTLRFSFAGSTEDMEEGLRRLVTWREGARVTGA